MRVAPDERPCDQIFARKMQKAAKRMLAAFRSSESAD